MQDLSRLCVSLVLVLRQLLGNRLQYQCDTENRESCRDNAFKDGKPHKPERFVILLAGLFRGLVWIITHWPLPFPTSGTPTHQHAVELHEDVDDALVRRHTLFLG